MARNQTSSVDRSGLGRFAGRRSLATVVGTGLTVLSLTLPSPQAAAFDVLPDERDSREECERRFCQIVLDGSEKGPPLKCDMTKTWDRVKIKKSGDENSLPWGFGDARCKLSLNIPRPPIVNALKQQKSTFVFANQTINCKIEGSGKTVNDLRVIAAPKIKFKNGRAHKIYFKVKDVDGDSSLTSLVWSVSKLADGLGFFKSGAVKEINKFIHETCSERYGKTTKAEEKAGKAKSKRADAQ